ncbi:RHS repeat protein [Photorhabdus luminescens subsp. sonorensis]|uniref:RHS repeat protein n=1 Tax=Photorhabdus luminescens subsp. sonorensis TaxID=1173677 RepID=A0A5C4RC50_PHOLU|nr:RHS repeat protein [Photorhabdus luminescens subsp. sonorensis]
MYADGTIGYEQSIHWLYEPGALTPSARFEKGQLYYVVSDHQGTVREILTEAGELLWAGRLLTWGEPERWPVLTVNDPRNLTCNFRFAGQYEDPESGLYYNRFRYYDNEIGQYLCADPLNLSGGFNPYGYVHDPVNWIDPLGLAGCPIREVNGTKIFGIGQKDKTPSHDQFSEVIANKLAMSGKFKEVYLNRSYSFANGKGTSGRRPDVMAIDVNGKVHSIELASKTDMGKKLPTLTSRNETAMSNLPVNKQGDILVFEHPYKAADMKSMLDNLISSI